MYPIILTSNNISLADNRSNSKKNYLNIPFIPTFSNNELDLNEITESYSDYYPPFNEHIRSHIWKLKSENSNGRLGEFSAIDNSFNKIIPNELSNEIVSTTKKSNSHSESTENVIDQNSSKIKEDNKTLGKKTKIFKVLYSNYHILFNDTKYDDYSSQMVEKVLNEINKKKEKINEKKGTFLSIGKKNRRKKKKNIFRRKQNSDNIRKKIKAKFLKALKDVINKNLKSAGSKFFFTFFPQSLVCKINKKFNKEIFDMELKDIFLTNFNYEKSGRNSKKNIAKYNHNLLVLNYLENNITISEKSNFNIIKNMKLSEIYKEYFSSEQFDMVISTLKKENENEKYIKNFIVKAKNFIEFFNS